tara:strand:+ start:1579 stop:1719 length:141 start_codon:yes stop_codon:yes gene_type:complete
MIEDPGDQRKRLKILFGGLDEVDYFLQLKLSYLLKLTTLDSLKENT